MNSDRKKLIYYKTKIIDNIKMADDLRNEIEYLRNELDRKEALIKNSNAVIDCLKSKVNYLDKLHSDEEKRCHKLLDDHIDLVKRFRLMEDEMLNNKLFVVDPLRRARDSHYDFILMEVGIDRYREWLDRNPEPIKYEEL